MSTLELKIAEVETSIYRTVQNLDWLDRFLRDAEVDVTELSVNLDSITVGAKTVESLAAWAKVPALEGLRHCAGNSASYLTRLPNGTELYVFVRAPRFIVWDSRRGVKTERVGVQWPERALGDDLQAFHASTTLPEVTA